MPIIDTPQPLTSSSVKIAIWHITENENILLEMCVQQSITLPNLATTHLAKRRIEVMAEHLLIKHLLGEAEIVNHHSNGAPYLGTPNCNISISHSKRYVIVAISMLNIGIDIETLSPQVLRVRTKFLCEQEMSDITDNDIEINTAAWTAKEALYKAIGVRGIDFSHDILIDSKALVKRENSYICQFEERIFNATTHIANDYATTLVTEIKGKSNQ